MLPSRDGKAVATSVALRAPCKTVHLNHDGQKETDTVIVLSTVVTLLPVLSGFPWVKGRVLPHGMATATGRMWFDLPGSVA